MGSRYLVPVVLCFINGKNIRRYGDNNWTLDMVIAFAIGANLKHCQGIHIVHVDPVWSGRFFVASIVRPS